MTSPRRFLAWWNKVEPPPEPPPHLESFDAIISVGPYNLPRGILPDQAVATVKQAVEALPGAVWIAVAHHPAGSGEGAVQVFPTGSSARASGDLHSRVEQAMAGAIKGFPIQSAAPPPRCEPEVPPVEEFMFSEPESGTRSGLSDSQAFTPGSYWVSGW